MNKVGTEFSDASFLWMLPLPLQGSGAVRDLHEAMSLGTAQSLALKTAVGCFVNDERNVNRLAA